MVVPLDSIPMRDRIPAQHTPEKLFLVPATEQPKQLPLGSTANGTWQSAPNPAAGLVEFEWLHDNLERLAGVAGLWVAIKGRQIRASSDDLEEILGWLESTGIADALVTQIPDDVVHAQYIIA